MGARASWHAGTAQHPRDASTVTIILTATDRATTATTTDVAVVVHGGTMGHCPSVTTTTSIDIGDNRDLATGIAIAASIGAAAGVIVGGVAITVVCALTGGCVGARAHACTHAHTRACVRAHV